MKCKLVDMEEYAHLILEFIKSEEYKDILRNMSYTNLEFEQGFIQGLVWSGLLMSKCKQYIGDINEDKVGK